MEKRGAQRPLGKGPLDQRSTRPTIKVFGSELAEIYTEDTQYQDKQISLKNLNFFKSSI